MNKRLLYNQIAALFLFSAFLVQTFTRNIIVIDYYANEGTYAIHCENKTRPMMHCNGKCQMMKKLEQEEKKEQENSQQKNENKIELICFQRNDYSIEPIYILQSEKYYDYGENIPINLHSSIFHPPQV